jgi:hypothetical protein
MRLRFYEMEMINDDLKYGTSLIFWFSLCHAEQQADTIIDGRRVVNSNLGHQNFKRDATKASSK